MYSEFHCCHWCLYPICSVMWLWSVIWDLNIQNSPYTFKTTMIPDLQEISSKHYNDVIMNMMASQITSLTIVYSNINSRHRSKKTSKLHITDLCVGYSQMTSQFPTQRASNMENVSIWWCHHEIGMSIMTAGILCCNVRKFATTVKNDKNEEHISIHFNYFSIKHMQWYYWFLI